MKLVEDAEPEFSLRSESFEEQLEEGEYWSVPREYFTVDGDTVRLDSRLASKLEWIIDGQEGGAVNIAAVTQRVEIDGTELLIQPGFFCSYVSEDDLK